MTYNLSLKTNNLFKFMTYKTSTDKFAKVTTAIITILFALFIIGQLLLITVEVKPVEIITVFLLALTYLAIYAYRPINYKLNEDELIIHRLISDVKISSADIKSVQLLNKEKLSGSWRILGVEGLFGYWGKFTNRKMGTMTWYNTRMNNYVLVTTIYDKHIILTPDKPELLVAHFNVYESQKNGITEKKFVYN